MRFLLELLVYPHICEVLDVGRHLGQGLGLILLLDLSIDTALSGRLVQLPL